jgi:hypothetical protein
MSVISAIDVAIGVTFLFLVVSLITTSAVELLEWALRRRSAYLAWGIHQLLRDPALLKAFYEHGQIQGLFQGTYVPGAGTETGKVAGGAHPSYIPSRNAALALIDLHADGHVQGPARNAIDAIVRVAGQDAEKVQAGIERWYDSTMDRVSGRYKRYAQIVSFGLGVLVAVIANADAIHVVQVLSSDDEVRTAWVRVATSAASELQQEASPLAGPARPADPGGAPADSAAGLGALPVAAIAADTQADSMAFEDLKRNVGRLRALNSPIGWPRPFRLPPLDHLPLAIVGWLLTGAATTLGAPFWFDLLNRIVVIRSTVKPTEKSPNEPPVDR